MMEKRRVIRFDLEIETLLDVRDEARAVKPPMLFSRDISCNGVFLITDNPYPVGTTLDLNLLLSQHEMGGMPLNEKINISTSGKVIRTDAQGMAVEFDKQYKISRLKPQA